MPGLTEEQRLFFEANGYLVVRDALTPDELAAVRDAVDEAEERWREDPSRAGVRRPDLEQVMAIMEYSPVLADLLEHPRIFPIVRDLIGPDVMMLDHDYFITPPGARVPWGWHRDLELPGVYHSRSRMLVKVFYVLEEIPPDGGATLVLPGSHRFPDEMKIPNSNYPEDLPNSVAMSLPAGSAYFITGRTYHSAGNNYSEVVRRLLIYTYGHKWMKVWQGYEPSEWLAGRAETARSRQILGLTDPYGADYGADAEGI